MENVHPVQEAAHRTGPRPHPRPPGVVRRLAGRTGLASVVLWLAQFPLYMQGDRPCRSTTGTHCWPRCTGYTRWWSQDPAEPGRLRDGDDRRGTAEPLTPAGRRSAWPPVLAPVLRIPRASLAPGRATLISNRRRPETPAVPYISGRLCPRAHRRRQDAGIGGLGRCLGQLVLELAADGRGDAGMQPEPVVAPSPDPPSGGSSGTSASAG